MAGVTAVMATSGPRHAALRGGGAAAGGSAAGAVIFVIVLIMLAVGLIFAIKTNRLPMPDRWRDVTDQLNTPADWRVTRQLTTLRRTVANLDVRGAVSSATAASFRFARFRNDAGEVELGRRADEVADKPDISSPTKPEKPSAAEVPLDQAEPAGSAASEHCVSGGRSFDNPMYSQQPSAEDHVPVSLLTPDGAICITPDGKSVVNPFFGLEDITDSRDDAQTVPAGPSKPGTTSNDPATSEQVKSSQQAEVSATDKSEATLHSPADETSSGVAHDQNVTLINIDYVDSSD